MNGEFIFDVENFNNLCSEIEKTPLPERSESHLEVELEDLNEKWTELKISFKALSISKDGEDTPELKAEAKETYSICASKYYNLKSEIMDMIKSFKLSDSISLSATRTSTRREDTVSFIKIPYTEVKDFDGDYNNWPSFRDVFQAMVIKPPGLSPVQKLIVLRNKVHGKAAAIVNRYPLSDQGFTLAWKDLESKFENPLIFVLDQVDVIMSSEPAASDSSEEIQRLQTTINNALASINAQGISTADWNPILLWACIKKLPDETLSLWEQHLESRRDIPKWEELNEFLTGRLEVVERLSRNRSRKVEVEPHSSTLGIFHTISDTQKTKYLCKMCNSSHALKDCYKFKRLNVNDRIDFVYKNKICLNCLAYTHLKANCSSQFRCHCKEPHHSLLHISTNTDQNQNRPFVSHNFQHKNQSFVRIDQWQNRNIKGTPVRSIPHTQLQHQAQFAPQTQSENQTFAQFTSQNNSQIPMPTESRSIDVEQGTSRHAEVNATFASINNLSNNEPNTPQKTLLPTAIVYIKHGDELIPARAFIDQGSDHTLISYRLQQQLRLYTETEQFKICGMGGQVLCNTSKTCILSLTSKSKDKEVKTKAIVVPKIAKVLPNFRVSSTVLSTLDLKGKELADSNFHTPGLIDILIGSDFTHKIFIPGVEKIGNTLLVQNTIFGWIVSGPVETQTVSTFCLTVEDVSEDPISAQLRKFWEQEEMQFEKPVSAENKYCEYYYKSTTTRDSSGRYIVRLPFKSSFPHETALGFSRSRSKSQYYRLESSLDMKPDLALEYNNVLKEYITLKHMEMTDSREQLYNGDVFSYYLPHHAVIRPEKVTSKVRVVFNASQKTSSGISLNDVLHTGPTLQTDLTALISNWRLFKYVYNGDIEKMYRQILLHPDDRQYQRIIFRPSPESQLIDYSLKTVTFGVNCAPFLAIRTLHQLANDVSQTFPTASEVLKKETYVDDILSGSHDVDSAIDSLSQVISALNSAGFPLKKITSNNSEILKSVPKENLLDDDFLKLPATSATKMLGLKWNALKDTFSYRTEAITFKENVTKRQVLSIVSKFFDPAGWISPVIIKAKILLQRLWLEGTNWDEILSPSSLKIWNQIVGKFSSINDISIPRWINYTPLSEAEIHGFCDASKEAYCAVVYLRTQLGNQINSHLLISKSKVAPIQEVSIPRLELCGAVLLSKLIKQVLSNSRFINAKITLWTDSSIVLSWLRKQPCNWKTYIANRTSEIIRNVGNVEWKHVISQDNPADLGSRGTDPVYLSNSTLWWNGPKWLCCPPGEWPQSMPIEETAIEARKIKTFFTTEEEENKDFLDQFSSYDRAIRVIGQIFRFLNRTHPTTKKHTHYESDEISQSEFKFVKNRLISLSQQRFYPREYSNLENLLPIPKGSALSSLSPFLDDNRIIRANGRLANAQLLYNEKFPIILHPKSRFCQLLISYTHKLLLHAEYNLMIRTIKEEYHVSRLKPQIRKLIRSCKPCIIYKKRSQSQIMAALPQDRSSFSLPFSVTGLDFAGPFQVKASCYRNSPYFKAYVCVFVCFATKAVHLELCSELSTNAFLAAFSRFVGRRGLPNKIMSDNGTNFVGAERALMFELKLFLKTVGEEVAKRYIAHNFHWSFIPPHAPHMGGLWEAAVKSFKLHFKKVAANHKFSFEEFSTLLARIEAVLNSRPLSPQSEDPQELLALTPGHFLRGAPLIAVPETSNIPLTLTNRWQKIRILHHEFSARWKTEYLKELQKRSKWKYPQENLKPDDLVIIQDDLLPPNEWRLGRIQKVHLGMDGFARSADIKTQTGNITRPIVKLCLLPSS